MLKIDSHQHFWKFDLVKDGWITDDMSILQNDFLPADLGPILNNYGFDGCISIHANQSEAENSFLLRLATDNNFIKGVVGWVDLVAEDITDKLDFYAQFNKIKGFRHILQGEENRIFMLEPKFMRGIKALEKHNFTYDILIHADQLSYIPSFVSRFSHQKFVIDHLGKPLIKTREIEKWTKQIKLVAEHKNVFCKVSGMVTEADWTSWKNSDFYPYLDIIFEAFGTGRVMFGSDWPVCRIAAEYDEVLSVMERYTAALSLHEQQLFWGSNAADFYRITNNY